MTFTIRGSPGTADKTAFLGKVDSPEGKNGHKKSRSGWLPDGLLAVRC
jgi:hypothetical protein